MRARTSLRSDRRQKRPLTLISSRGGIARVDRRCDAGRAQVVDAMNTNLAEGIGADALDARELAVVRGVAQVFRTPERPAPTGRQCKAPRIGTDLRARDAEGVVGATASCSRGDLAVVVRLTGPRCA